MSEKMVVLVNGQSYIEYDRSKALSDSQLQYLEQMDVKMDAGIELGKEKIAAPDDKQKAQFVALTLLTAITDENDQLIAATSSYLAVRYPDLKQVKADVDVANNGMLFDLIFDQEYKNQVKVSFNS